MLQSLNLHSVYINKIKSIIKVKKIISIKIFSTEQFSLIFNLGIKIIYSYFLEYVLQIQSLKAHSVWELIV